MNITTDYIGAKEMSSIFNAVAKKQSIKIDDIDSILKSAKAYKMWLTRVGGEDFKKEYLNVWSSILNDTHYQGNLAGLHKRYKIMLEDIDLLNTKLKFAQGLDFSIAEELVSEYLPTNTKLMVNIYFLIDGYNGGTIINNHNYTQCISVLDPENFRSFSIYGLVHELHHIGSRYWQNEDKLRKSLVNKKNHVSLAVNLLGSILDEGSAVYYIDNKINKNVKYELSSKLIGRNQYEQIISAYEIEKTKISQRIEELDILLRQLIDGIDEYDTMKNKVKSYYFMQGMKPSLDKLIGEEMVGTIDKVFGKEKVMDCLINLQEFILTYNRAARKLNRYELSEELIEKWNETWSEEKNSIG